jgi:hypothetical protein
MSMLLRLVSSVRSLFMSLGAFRVVLKYLISAPVAWASDQILAAALRPSIVPKVDRTHFERTSGFCLIVSRFLKSDESIGLLAEESRLWAYCAG